MTASTPKASLVIATYNRLTSLLALLERLAQQTLSPDLFEVVIVDDGSKVPAEPELRKLQTPYRLQIVTQKNQGQAAARHAGIEQARGGVIVIVDDDMELAEHFLAAHLEAHERGFEVVLGHIRPHTQLERLPLFERFHAAQLEAFASSMRKGHPARGVHLCTGNVSFRRSDYVELGGFDRLLRRSEDRELGVRFESAGKKLTFSEAAYSVHQSDHGSLAVWRDRAYNYGFFDSLISEKHPEAEIADPWRFLFLVSPLSRPLLLLAVGSPTAGRALSRAAMSLSGKLDSLGHVGLAIKGTTLAYGLEYFAGVRAQAGSLRRSLGRARRYMSKRKEKKDR